MKREMIQEILDFNTKAIAKTLVSLGLDSVTVEYSGSGDSGNGYDVSVTPDNSSLPEAMVNLKVVESVYNADLPVGDRWVHQIVFKDCDLEESVHEMTEMVIQFTGNSGYENNDGGFGELKLHASGQLEYSHSDYVVETSTTSYEFDFSEKFAVTVLESDNES